MASGGSMASIHEDTTTLAETAIVVPAVKKMEGEVEISITTDDGTITSGGILMLRETDIIWQPADKGTVHVFDLETVDVSDVKDNLCSFDLHHDTWHGVVSGGDASDWVKYIRSNIISMWMRTMMCEVFSGPVLQPLRSSTYQDFLSCRQIYRRHCDDLQRRKMTRQERKSLSMLLETQNESDNLQRQVLELENTIHEENTFSRIDDKMTPVIQAAEESLNMMGTSIFSLQKKLEQLKETTRFSDEVVDTTTQTNKVHFAMGRMTSELARGKAMVISRKKRQYDFFICHDQEEGKISLPVVKELTEAIEKEGFVGQHQHRDCPPGTQRDQYHRSACIESDVVICLIGKTHLKGRKGVYLDNIMSAIKIKQVQGADDHVIPVIYDTSKEKATKWIKGSLLKTRSPLLPILEMAEYVSVKDEQWEQKILQVFQQLPAGNALKRLYFTLLPEWCAPLLRGPLTLEKAWLDVFLNPEMVIKSIHRGKNQNNTDLDRVTDVTDIFKFIKPGGRIVIIADGGMGKSTVVSHITRAWGSDHQNLRKYGFVFLAPQRLINNHTEDLDRIICSDLKLLETSSMAKFRTMMRSSSSQSMFLVDGFDELDERAKTNTTMIKLIRGEIARQSTVVVTTRPHCADEVLKVIGDTYIDVRIEGLADETVIERANVILTEATKQSKLDHSAMGSITDYLPIELLRMPLLLNIATYIWKCQVKDLKDNDTIRKFDSMTDIFNAILGIMIGIKEEKRRTTEHVNFYKSMEDSNIPRSTWSLLLSLAAMSFECLERSELIISTETLAKYRLNAVNCGQIGFIHISSGSRSQGSFVHNLFMEHCAGFYIANNDKALQSILDKISSSYTTLSRALGLYTNALIFAVGFKPRILDQLSRQKFMIPVVRMTESANTDMDLSLEAQLLQECSDEEAKSNFSQTLMTSDFSAPLTHTSSHRLNALGYEWMQKHLGVDKCSELLKRLHQDDVTSDGLVLQGNNGERFITDSFLLSHLPHITFREVNTLYVYHAKMIINADVTADREYPKTDAIANLHLNEIAWTVDQLVRFLKYVPALHDLKKLSLGRRCKLKAVSTEETSLTRVNVGEIAMSCPISLDLLRSMLCVISCHELTIEKDARLLKRTTKKTYPPDNTEGVSELYVPSSWSTEDVVVLITEVPSLTQGTRVVQYTTAPSAATAARASEETYTASAERTTTSITSAVTDTAEISSAEAAAVAATATAAAAASTAAATEVAETAVHAPTASSSVTTEKSFTVSRHLQTVDFMGGVDLYLIKAILTSSCLSELRSINFQPKSSVNINKLQQEVEITGTIPPLDVIRTILTLPSLADLRAVKFSTTSSSINFYQEHHEVEITGTTPPLDVIIAVLTLRLSELNRIKLLKSTSVKINRVEPELQLKGQVPMNLLAWLIPALAEENSMSLVGECNIIETSEPSVYIDYVLNGPGECERTLALGDGVHCEVDTLCSLLSLVSHPEWVDVLILEKGCVLEAPSTTTTTPQKAVCYVKRLYVYTTLSDVILERLLSQLGGVDLLWLGDSMSRCEVTCDGNTMTSLPGVGRLMLGGVRGLRCWLQHVRAPGVMRVWVKSWASKREEDTVTEDIIRQACPQADVKYDKKAKPIEN